VQNLAATTDPGVYGTADVTVVNVALDVSLDEDDEPHVDLDSFEQAIRTLGAHMPPGSLVVIASTVPPGTTELVAAPALFEELRSRSMPPEAILLAHSYERVMPGPDYLSSITSYWRVFAGRTPEAADRCEGFLAQVIDVTNYPLTRLESTTASETAKILENSYRAVTIAMMEEWGRFAEAVGIDMFEIVDAIRLRPTHANLREPGFGVGGYCITKDPLLGSVAARQLFDLPDIVFPFSRNAVATNAAMPLASLRHVERLLGGDLSGKRLLLLGVSYRGGVADTRNSPAARFVSEARKRGASVMVTDPMVSYWPELDIDVSDMIPLAAECDAVIFGVAHDQYRHLDVVDWLGDARPVVFDAANILSPDTRTALTTAGVPVHGVGRGG
jgi:nucleotide sugar dehydrogenase